MSPTVTMKALLESGVHFGHRTNKWNPKMRSFIFTERNGIHIIDLQQTVKLLDEAYDFVRDNVAKGGTILFVGTKRQAQDTIADEAERCGMPYVNERWLGGTITNWVTIQKRIFELERLERMRDSGQVDLLTKKEGLMIEREIERLDRRLHGIRTMKQMPDVLFAVDVTREDTAVHEANLKDIPVVAMVDTNCDPKNIDYIIPSNDDAIRAIKLLVGKIADAVMEGKAIRTKTMEEEELEAEAMPAAIRRFTEEEELEDKDLLGKSTLKYMDSAKKAEVKEEEAEDEVEAEETVEKAETKAEAEEEATEEPVKEAETKVEPAAEPAEETEVEKAEAKTKKSTKKATKKQASKPDVAEKSEDKEAETEKEPAEEAEAEKAEVKAKKPAKKAAKKQTTKSEDAENSEETEAESEEKPAEEAEAEKAEVKTKKPAKKAAKKQTTKSDDAEESETIDEKEDD